MVSEDVFEYRDTRLKYLTREPDAQPGCEKYPCIIYLHGAGSRGDAPWVIANNGPLKAAADGLKIPLRILAPLCPGPLWQADMPLLIAFIRWAKTLPDVDADRVSVTGVSLGGYGAWCVGRLIPGELAALVPVCGGGIYACAGEYGSLPVRAYHGRLDTVVQLQESVKQVEAIRRAGGNAELVIYGDCAHNAWTRTYADPELYTWLSEQRVSARG